ncbi:hypothetical protein ACEQ8H_001611 [Pleosporales sp. CAS-2024a]
MVKVAVVGGTGNVATELLRAPIRSAKHEITIFTRSDAPANPVPGLAYKKVEYRDLANLTNALQGFDTCLSFIITQSDIDNTVQKNLIHACIAAGVRRFAPSEWAIANGSGVPSYENKDGIAAYLHDLKEKDKMGNLQYCLFQPSVFIDYFAHPYPLSPNLITWPFFIDLEKRRAMVLDDGTLPIVLTAISDVSEVLALALDDARPWPRVGGMQGVKTSINEIVAVGKKIRGSEWTVEYVKSEDMDKGQLKTSWVPQFSHPAIPADQHPAFSTMFVVCFFVAMKRGAWNVSREFNDMFPEFQFLGLEEYLAKAWKGRA